MKKNLLKSQKGVTLLPLIITIVVILMLTSTIIFQVNDSTESSRLNDLYADIKLLEDKILVYYNNYSEIPVMELEISALPEEIQREETDKFYEIDLTKLQGITLKYGNKTDQEDIYIVNSRTLKVYYLKGIELRGKRYYYYSQIDLIKPEIKMIAGEKNSEGVYTTEVSIQIMPGEDVDSKIEKTTYSINGSEEKEISTLTNNILTIFEDGIYSIKVKNYDKDNNILGHTTININIQIKNKEYRFITNWNVTLGEEEGSETYSTVVLPVYKNSSYDATIYWGDGTRTILQHKTNGITLTDAELKEKVTHNYTLVENDNAERTIEIEGTYTDFRMNSSTSTPTKLKLTWIEQWGNTKTTNFNFKDCTNLSGIIPKNDLTELNCTSYCFNLTGIEGFEEGFCFSGGNFTHAVRECSNLKTLPNSFKIPEGTQSLASMFRGCSSLENLPDNFEIPDSVTSLYETFYQCSNLKEIPDSFKIPENVITVLNLFAQCSNLEKIPSDFILPKGVTAVANLFNQCKKLETIPEDFVLPDGITSIQGMFTNCPIKRLPSNFKIPYGVTNMIGAFSGCTIEELPENFEIPETVTNMYNAFRGCWNLKGTITIKANPTNYGYCFGYGTAMSSGSTLTVNYSKNCTNIDAILATGNANYVVKGSQID